MRFTTWCLISNTVARRSSRLMSSHDISLAMDLGFSNSFTHSVDTSQPTMDHTLDTLFPMTSLPTNNVTNFDSMVSNVP